MEEQDPDRQEFVSPRRRRWYRDMYTLLIVALLGAVVAGVLLASSVWSWKSSNQPQGTTTEVSATTIDPEKACSLQNVYDAIKQALFDRAAQKRGGDRAAFQRVADFSLLQVESPFLRSANSQQQRIDCTGTAVLELPPQITVADGSSTLSGPIDYFIQSSANGPAAVSVGNADIITVPLSTIPLATIAMTAPAAPSVGNAMNEVATGPQPFTSNAVQPPPANEIEPVPPAEEPGPPTNESDRQPHPESDRNRPLSL